MKTIEKIIAIVEGMDEATFAAFCEDYTTAGLTKEEFDAWCAHEDAPEMIEDDEDYSWDE